MACFSSVMVVISGNMIFQRPVDRRTEDRPELPLELRKMLQAVPDAPEAEERVALWLHRLLLGELVGTEVQRADGQRPTVEEL